MKKGIFILLSRFALFLVLGLFFCRANASMPSLTALPPAALPTAPLAATSSGSSGVDSGRVRPPGGATTTVAPLYSGIVVPAGPVTNEQYANLAACPSTPVCPDINGRTLGNAAVNCPDFCRVDRDVVESTVGNVVRVLSTTAAACPLGYAVAATYKLGKEIMLNNHPPPAPFPIFDPALYNAYRLAGYSCMLTATQGTYEICGGSGLSSSLEISFTLTTPYPITPGNALGQYTSGGGVGTYCKPESGTAGFGLPVYTDNIPFPPCTMACPGALASMVDTKYAYHYSFVMCIPPAGLYYTENMIPTALVCAVRKHAWLKGN